MILGPVRVMEAGVVVMMCVEKVATLLYTLATVHSYNTDNINAL